MSRETHCEGEPRVKEQRSADFRNWIGPATRLRHNLCRLKHSCANPVACRAEAGSSCTDPGRQPSVSQIDSSRAEPCTLADAEKRDRLARLLHCADTARRMSNSETFNDILYQVACARHPPRGEIVQRLPLDPVITAASPLNSSVLPPASLSASLDSQPPQLM